MRRHCSRCLRTMDRSKELKHYFIPMKSLPSCGVKIRRSADSCTKEGEVMRTSFNARYDTFFKSKTWPNSQLRENWRRYLSGDNFYHPTNPYGLLSDEIVCASCGLCIINLRNAMELKIHELHESLSPDCGHIKQFNELWGPILNRH